jgi:hypothetical protein
MTKGFRCDNCAEFTQAKAWIFSCIECGKEICESCMYSWATCKECAAGKSDEFLQQRFDSAEPGDCTEVITRFLTRVLSR